MNCKVCNQPIADHHIVSSYGVAQVKSPDGEYQCSSLYGERLQFVGEINTLRTIIRSLRWRAGRMRPGGEWTPDDLDAYSDHWERRLNRLLTIVREYYPW